MAKTTATVTVGADTKPFARAMRGLGKTFTSTISAGVGGVGNMAISGLSTGLGMGLGMLGLNSIGSLFNKLRVLAPELEGAFVGLQVAVADALTPAAKKLGEVFVDMLPTIRAYTEEFGTMLADAIEFWTQEALDPMVWKDIGNAIVESVRDAALSMGLIEKTPGGSTRITNLPEAVDRAAEEAGYDSVDRWLIQNNPAMHMLRGVFDVGNMVKEGADSL